jgi:outer membrane receptor protein involved in Fe transport
VSLSGAVFHKRIRDLIQSIRDVDGFRTPTNVGRAHITGFELGAKLDFERLKLSANYAYVDSTDLDTGRPLPLVPKSQINMILDVLPRPDWTLSFWGRGASGSETSFGEEILAVPGYFVANVGIAKALGRLEVSARVENLFDSSYFTEPGFPVPSRSFRALMRFRGGPRPAGR